MKPDTSGSELFKGVMLAHLILGLHLAVFALIGLLVIFFGGIALYWGWILLGGLIIAALGGLFIYRMLKTRGRSLVRDLNGVTVPSGGSLEVSFLGGLASVKFDRPAPSPKEIPVAAPALLEDPESQRVRELTSLGQMYEKNLITREEFERAKGAILNPVHRREFGPGSLEN